MKNFVYNTLWGMLGGVAFGLFYFGWPVLFLVLSHDWQPSMSRTSLKLLFYAPGIILGITAWVVVSRYSRRWFIRRASRDRRGS